MSSAAFLIGDLVCRNDRGDELAHKDCGEVVGFCPGPRWIRVKTFDGRYRIWLKDHVKNVDADMQEGNYSKDAGVATPEQGIRPVRLNGEPDTRRPAPGQQPAPNK